MTQTEQLFSIHRLVWMGLLAALTAVGAMISIPIVFISPVPVSLQTMFVCLAGLILGPRGGALAMALYLVAGLIGLPVFTGGKAGLAAFLGPTGGYALGFVPAAVISGFGGGGTQRPLVAVMCFCAAGTLIDLFLGTVQLAAVLDISVTKAVAVGLIPFLPGGAVKCVAAAVIYRFLLSRKLVPA